MPVTRQGDTIIMTPETVQAMIDQALQRNSTNTHDDGSQNSGGGPGRPVQPTRVCSYTDFMKFQPLNFKGTEGVVGLSRWFEKMESVFHINGCAIDNQVKFATCKLLGTALTWWNGHVRTLGHDAAYAMTWEIIKKKLTNKYCPKGEIKKLEIELWNFKTEKVEKYISGLPNNIHGNVMQAENKRKLDNNNQAQQQLLKKQNVVQAYVVGSEEKKPYGRSKPLCPKCNYHHDGECAPKCTNFKKVSHLTKDCWHPINANNQRTITCYECGNQGHNRSDCPVLKNQGTKARGMVYDLGGGETDQDINNMEDDINA
ncbi:reverse transcriptase domain-containing protein [Tanacetum coccineum]